MWLISVRTAVWLWGALLGAAVLTLIAGPGWVTLLAGALAGGVLATLLLGGPADRADRWLATPKTGSIWRRRRGEDRPGEASRPERR